MNPQHIKRISKLMSLVLRHKPEVLELTLDPNGWVNTSDLIDAMKSKEPTIDMDLLEQVVSGNDKQRFSFNEDGSMIRANQGHSVNINLQLEPIKPPDVLYHGTVEKFFAEIQADGLKKMSRQHVHLSADIETARNVGSRRGKPVILKIDSKQMQDQGYQFYISENKVWLTDHVPSKFISR